MRNNYLIDKKIGLLLWKASNLWQNLLRNFLLKYHLTLNEFIVLETLYHDSQHKITQIHLSRSSGVNTSVVSTTLKILQKKKLIEKKSDLDNRKKNIALTKEAESLINRILPIINNIEKNFFMKLGREETNFTNSMKIITGKKIRIKAEKT